MTDAVTTANILGLPELLTEEEAKEALETAIEAGLLSEEDLALIQGKPSSQPAPGVKTVAEMWSTAARWYWVQAHNALRARDFRAMRDFARIARERDTHGCPENRLLSAIYGGEIAPPDEKEVSRGEHVSAEAAMMAKKAVMAEMEAHAQRMRQKRAAERAANASAAAKAREERAKARLEQAKAREAALAQKAAAEAEEKASATERQRQKKLAAASAAIEWARQALYIAAAREGGVVVSSISSAEEIVEAETKGELVGEILTEDGRILGLRPISVLVAGEMPRARDDYPAYLSKEVRQRPTA